MKKNSRLVYSTESGRIKHHDDAPLQTQENGDGIVRIFRESRKGSRISLIKGLPVTADLKGLAKTLKKKLGVGGGIKSGVIEMQTDQRDKIKVLLEAEHYTVKIAGG